MKQESGKECICGSKRIYFRKFKEEFVCYDCGRTWISEKEKREAERKQFILFQILRDKGDLMTQPRYLQINEGAKSFSVGSDKTILDDIMEILNKHGKFQVVRDSLVFTVIENKDWKPKEVAQAISSVGKPVTATEIKSTVTPPHTTTTSSHTGGA